MFTLLSWQSMQAQSPVQQSGPTSADDNRQNDPKAATGRNSATLPNPQNPLSDHQTIVVTGTFEPIPLNESIRSVTSLDVRKDSLLFSSDAEYLRLDPSIDLQERAPGGVQMDVSIRGATFGQTLVLINGLRINDAQTGHHNFDLPLPLDSVDHIEVLHGAGSTFYGADALGGAVNFITASATVSQFRLRAGAGNFGYDEERVVGSYSTRIWSEQITADRNRSTGFMADRDFRSAAVSSETHVHTALGYTTVLLAMSDRPFGAGQFYGPYSSWERTKGWFTALSQDLGEKMKVAFGYRRHTDEFVLLRDDPAVYENNHADQSWQISLRRHDDLKQNILLSYGAEGFRDQIDSNNLGRHARNWGALYAAIDLRALRRFSFSVGAREESYQGTKGQFSPSVSGAYWISQSLKLRGAASHAFRLPTYTDLYYSDPSSIGNPNLRPETAWSYEGGVDWDRGGRWGVSATVYWRNEKNGIDYVRASPDDVWRAVNFDRVNFTGVEALLRLRAFSHSEFSVGYSGIYGAQQALHGLESQYVFNYPTHNAFVAWQGTVFGQLAARTRIGITQRYADDAYALWDFALARATGRIRPYVQLTNLGNTTYHEVQDVRMPGHSVIGGLEWILFEKTK